ncbi:MAG: PAS domain-containing protein [Flavobacteriales bacterium]|jgi:PAS domain-containing protein|nr:PAS domain-containing protein [Flavobacteriales bacterium]
MSFLFSETTLAACETAEQVNQLILDCTDPHVYVSVHNEQGMYLKASDTIEGITGFPFSEMKNQSCYDYFHSEDLVAVLKSHAGVTIKPSIGTVNYRFKTKSGNFVKLESLSKQLQGKDLAGTIVVITRLVD